MNTRWIWCTALLMAMLLTTSADRSAAGSASWMPLTRGAVWTYSVKGGQAPTSRMQAIDQKGGRWALKWDKRDMEAALNNDGVLLFETRLVGAAAAKQVLPAADLRWSGPTTWKTKTMSGCIGCTIEGTRLGNETVTVPAGKFDCLKITNGEMGVTTTYWVARGVGIVKRVYTQPGQTIEWTLQSFKPGKA